jgi:transcriptional regulator with XRE-family HTH domain
MTFQYFRDTIPAMKKYNLEIGALIKEYRLKAGLTQLELAHKLGYEIPQFISLIENGHSKVPLNVVAQLITLLNIPERHILNALVEAYETETKDILHRNKKRKSEKRVG